MITMNPIELITIRRNESVPQMSKPYKVQTPLLVTMSITSRTYSISFPKGLWVEIDNKRADVPRSLFIRRIIERQLTPKGDKK